MGIGLNGPLVEFGMAVLSATHACTCTVHTAQRPYKFTIILILNTIIRKHPQFLSVQYVESSMPQNKMKKEFWSTL